MKKLDSYAAILRIGLFFLILREVQCETECINEVRHELYMCDNGCCGNSPDQYCCATSSYIAYIIVAAILLSVLAVLLIALWYKKKTVSRRRTGPSGISIRMTEDRPSNLPRACIDGTDRGNFNYYHLQWVFGQPMAPPPYYVDSASAYGTHASNTIGGNTSGRIVEWQQHQNTNEYNRTIGNNSPPPPYSHESNA